MLKVFKYELEIDDEQKIELPERATILALEVQRNVPCLWCLVDPKDQKIARQILCYGTGQPMPSDILVEFDFVATTQHSNGDLVLHWLVEKAK